MNPQATLSVSGPRFPRLAATWKAIFRFCTGQPLGAVALLIIVVMLTAGIFAQYLAPYDPIAARFDAALQAPSAAHLMGTDAYGRDIFSRLLYGARSALILGMVTAFIGAVIGGAIGVTSAYFGGLVDATTQRLNDVLLSIPLIVSALVVVAILGRREIAGVDMNLLVAITLPYIPVMARVMRSAALTVRVTAYIEAARSLGFSHTRVIVRHMIPNLVSPWLVMVSAFTAQTILLEASLSFLGLGVSEPTPAWGLMLFGVSLEIFSTAPWVIVFPGLAISLAVFAFSLFGDALRDALDPRYHR